MSHANPECVVSRPGPWLLLWLCVAPGLGGCIERNASGGETPPDAAIVEAHCRSDAECDDDNPCTDDRCEPRFGCVFQPHLRACDDGDRCTVGERCSASRCTGGQPLDCDDGDLCTVDRCDPDAGCTHAAASEGTWVGVDVDDIGDVGWTSQLGVDQAGTLHVAYRDGERGALRYGRRAPGGAWHTEQVPGVGAGHGAVAVGPDGRVHLSSIEGDDHIMHAVRDEAWHVTRHGPISQGRIDLEVDPAGRGRLVFTDPHDRVRVATWIAGAEQLVVDDPIDRYERWSPGLAIDRTRGLLHVVSSRWTEDHVNLVELATRRPDEGAWQVEPIADGTGVRVDPRRSLEIDAAGRLHLGFRDDDVLRYAVRGPEGGWRIETPVGEQAVSRVALTLDTEGRPILVYGRAHEVALFAAIGDGDGGWRIEEIVRRPGASADWQGGLIEPSVVFDPIGQTWHLTYYDGGLRHVWRCR